MKITLPVQLNPVSRRKDKSVKLSFETRELNHEEIMTLMAMEGMEMWLVLSSNSNDLEIPSEEAHVEEKSPAYRLRSVLYVLYKKMVDNGKYVGPFENFYRERMEISIQKLKDSINS